MHSNERKRKKFQFHYPQLSLGKHFWNWICFRISFIIYPELSIEMQHTRLNAKNKRFVSMERVGWPTIVQLHLYRLPKVTQHTHTHLTFNAWSVCNATFDLFTFDIYKKSKKYKIVYISNCLRQSTRDDWQREKESVMLFCFSSKKFWFQVEFFCCCFHIVDRWGRICASKKMHISSVYVSTFLFSLHEKWIHRTIIWFHDMRAFFSSCNKKMVQENVWKPLQNNINNYNKMKTIRGIKECHRRKIKCFHEAHTFMLWNECSWKFKRASCFSVHISIQNDYNSYPSYPEIWRLFSVVNSKQTVI